jgi:hypothetical protein
MPVVLVKNVHCGVCGKLTPLLASSLESKLDYRPSSTIYGLEIFFACPHCNTVGQTVILPQVVKLAIAEGRLHPGDLVPFRVLLECAKRRCETRIEVLGAANTDIDTSKLRNLCRHWKFSRDVRCENMHPPIYPIQIGSSATG